MRLEGILWGLPNSLHIYSYHPDEALILRHLTVMKASGTLNPHSFINPSLHFYLYGILLRGLNTIGVVPPIKETLMPDELARLFLAGRLLTTMLGLASILLIFYIGKRWFEEKTALLSAAFLAILPLHVVHSHYLTVEVPSTFWILVAVLFFTRIEQSKGGLAYIAAGVASGLAAAAKYTGILCVPILLLAHLYIHRKKRVRAFLDRRILFFLMAVLAAFFLGTPYFFLSPIEVYNDILSLFKINIHAAKASYPIISLLVYSLGIPMILLAVLGMIIAIVKRKTADVFLISWIALSLILIFISGTPFTRHLVLMSPFIILLAARGSSFLFEKRFWRGSKRWAMTIAALFLAFVCGWTFLSSYAYVSLMEKKDIRDIAAEWINNHVPIGASMGVVQPWFYTPPLDWSRYRMERTGFNSQRLLSIKPEYFVITDFEYRENSYIRRFFSKDYSDSEIFIKYLGNPELYHVKRSFEITPNISGISFRKGFPPHDWMYVYPTIRLLERSDHYNNTSK